MDVKAGGRGRPSVGGSVCPVAHRFAPAMTSLGAGVLFQATLPPFATRAVVASLAASLLLLPY